MEEGFRSRAGSGILLVSILLTASALRAPIAAVGPVLGMIQETNGIGGAAAGILTALPVLAFAAISPLAPICAREAVSPGQAGSRDRHDRRPPRAARLTAARFSNERGRAP